MTWDPALYARFAAPRLRPALDLLAQIPLDAPARITDLGCGSGQITQIMAERWPMAQVVGVDQSPHMLDLAPQGRCRWICSDMALWRADPPQDLIFSNAALHWLDEHERLFGALAGQVAVGGVMAVQMPRNHQAPSHQLILETAAQGPWADRLRPVLRPCPVGGPEEYYRILAPLCRQVEIWETSYLHVLEGDNPVLDWTRGSTLRPLLAALPEDMAKDFLAAYGDRLKAAYARQADGKTLLPFRRLFMVARI